MCRSKHHFLNSNINVYHSTTTGTIDQSIQHTCFQYSENSVYHSTTIGTMFLSIHCTRFQYSDDNFYHSTKIGTGSIHHTCFQYSGDSVLILQPRYNSSTQPQLQLLLLPCLDGNISLHVWGTRKICITNMYINTKQS